MLKKMAVLGVAGLIGAGAVAGTGAWSYVRTCAHSASETVRDSVPIQWEIKRARQMIEDLKPEIAKNLQVVAKEEVEVKRLASEIAKKEAILAKGHGEILRLKGDLESGSVRFVYAGRSYTDEQVRDDLANRFKQYKVHEQTTNKLTQILNAREKNLTAAQQKLDEMLAARRELEVEVENLQARLTMVEVAQTSSPMSLDDSQLSETKRLLDDIRTRIDVSEQMIANEGALMGTIQLDNESDSADLLNQITDYFGADRAEIEALIADNSN
ncbi:MAG: hypothetical protein KDB03_16845 [Planctomycetales bacterium]|nr:hypothetical protein [Planctomycetales bacterium]